MAHTYVIRKGERSAVEITSASIQEMLAKIREYRIKDEQQKIGATYDLIGRDD